MNKPTAEDVLANDWPLSLDRDFESSCPCAVIEGEGFTVVVHCWRRHCPDCQYSGVHVRGDLPEATRRKIAEHVRDNNGWTGSTDWTIVL